MISTKRKCVLGIVDEVPDYTHCSVDQQEKWRKDSDTVFTAISTGDFDNYKQALDAVCFFYVPDMEFSRAGISHALVRLEKFYRDK